MGSFLRSEPAQVPGQERRHLWTVPPGRDLEFLQVGTDRGFAVSSRSVGGDASPDTSLSSE